MHHARAPLLHPLALFAVAVMALNDHVLKQSSPSALTGKLSDFAGLLFFPLLLLGAWSLLAGPAKPAREPARLWSCIAVSALVFTAIQLNPWAGSAFAWSLGALQWPIHWLLGPGSAPLQPVAHTADPTDLWALPSLGVAAWLARPRRAATLALCTLAVAGCNGSTIYPGAEDTSPKASLSIELSPVHPSWAATIQVKLGTATSERFPTAPHAGTITDVELGLLLEARWEAPADADPTVLSVTLASDRRDVVLEPKPTGEDENPRVYGLLLREEVRCRTKECAFNKDILVKWHHGHQGRVLLDGSATLLIGTRGREFVELTTDDVLVTPKDPQ